MIYVVIIDDILRNKQMRILREYVDRYVFWMINIHWNESIYDLRLRCVCKNGVQFKLIKNNKLNSQNMQQKMMNQIKKVYKLQINQIKFKYMDKGQFLTEKSYQTIINLFLFITYQLIVIYNLFNHLKFTFFLTNTHTHLIILLLDLAQNQHNQNHIINIRYYNIQISITYTYIHIIKPHNIYYLIMTSNQYHQLQSIPSYILPNLTQQSQQYLTPWQSNQIQRKITFKIKYKNSINKKIQSYSPDLLTRNKFSRKLFQKMMFLKKIKQISFQTPQKLKSYNINEDINTAVITRPLKQKKQQQKNALKFKAIKLPSINKKQRLLSLRGYNCYNNELSNVEIRMIKKSETLNVIQSEGINSPITVQKQFYNSKIYNQKLNIRSIICGKRQQVLNNVIKQIQLKKNSLLSLS